jgi:RNA polymerase sigma-70 factor, ECF subfamily
VPPPPTDANGPLERFRAYLETLKSIQLDPRLRSRFGLSDVIQITLLKAYRALERITALDEEGQKRWLRRMLLNTLRDEIARNRAARRDVALEQSLEAAVEASSFRVNEWLAVEDTSPSERLIEQEEGLRLLEALAQLPERKREAIILQRWHGWKLADIAAHLGCTTGAVAGLHAHGLAKLKELLPEME